jgi:UDP-N-acetylmuramoyl-L-alanyl-D-glutamate--2,6-diaminopimelate ligase
LGGTTFTTPLPRTGASLALDIDAGKIQSALNKMQPVPGRLESVSCGQPFAVFVDYAHTHDALHNVLTTLREITRGRLLLLFGCGGQSGRRQTREDGAASPRSWPTSHSLPATIRATNRPKKLRNQIEEGFRSVKKRDYSTELDRRRAITQIISMAKAGDTVFARGQGSRNISGIRGHRGSFR